MKPKTLAQWFVIAAVGLTEWLAAAQQPPAPAVTRETLINAPGDGTEWLSYGHDYGATHFSPLSQINTRNVNRLKLAWSSATGVPQGTVEATPLMHNILPWDVMVAFDARTGQEKWRWDPVKQQERWRTVFGQAGPGGERFRPRVVLC